MTDDEVAARIAGSFSRQGLMATLGATLRSVNPGEVVIELPLSPRVSQQHGFAHAGAVAAIADSAAGYAGLTLMPADAGVLTVEYKINLMAPAAGERLVARGFVMKPGRTIVVAQAEVEAEADGRRKGVALLTATLMVVQGRDGIAD